MQQIQLSSSEKAKIENDKQIFVLLRLINFIQKFYTHDRIDKQTYNLEINRLLQKYNRFTQLVPNHNLDDFCKRFNIAHEQISWAKLVIKNGTSTQGLQMKQANMFISATSTFIQTIDCLRANQSNPMISQVKNELESLDLILKKLAEALKSSEYSNKCQSYQKMLKNYVTPKSITESLTQSQHQELLNTVEGLFQMMQHLANY